LEELYWGASGDALIEYFMVIQKILKKTEVFAMFKQSPGA
jgi:hypothetical protein